MDIAAQYPDPADLAQIQPRTLASGEMLSDAPSDWMEQTAQITPEEQAILEAPPAPPDGSGGPDTSQRAIEAIAQRVAAIMREQDLDRLYGDCTDDMPVGGPSLPDTRPTVEQVVGDLYGQCGKAVSAVIADMTDVSNRLVALVTELNALSAPSDTPMHVAQHLSQVAHRLQAYASSLQQAAHQATAPRVQR